MIGDNRTREGRRIEPTGGRWSVSERSGRTEKSEDGQIGDGKRGGRALSEIRREIWEPALQM